MPACTTLQRYLFAPSTYLAKIHKTDATFSLILRRVTRFRQVGSGEIPLDEEELENESETDYQDGFCGIVSRSPQTVHPETIIDVPRRRSSLLCDVYDVNVNITSNLSKHR